MSTPKTWEDVLAWAAKSTVPPGDCEGFANNKFVSAFGKFRFGYYSAYTALADTKKRGDFHKDLPPNDRVVFVWFQYPTYGHVMLYYNGVCLGDTSRATKFLNKSKTVGTVTIKSYPFPYLGWSYANGVNTIPAISKKVVAPTPTPPPAPTSAGIGVPYTPPPVSTLPPAVVTSPEYILSAQDLATIKAALATVDSILSKEIL